MPALTKVTSFWSVTQSLLVLYQATIPQFEEDTYGFHLTSIAWISVQLCWHKKCYELFKVYMIRIYVYDVEIHSWIVAGWAGRWIKTFLWRLGIDMHGWKLLVRDNHNKVTKTISTLCRFCTVVTSLSRFCSLISTLERQFLVFLINVGHCKYIYSLLIHRIEHLSRHWQTTIKHNPSPNKYSTGVVISWAVQWYSQESPSRNVRSSGRFLSLRAVKRSNNNSRHQVLQFCVSGHSPTSLVLRLLSRLLTS